MVFEFKKTVFHSAKSGALIMVLASALRRFLGPHLVP